MTTNESMGHNRQIHNCGRELHWPRNAKIGDKMLCYGCNKVVVLSVEHIKSNPRPEPLSQQPRQRKVKRRPRGGSRLPLDSSPSPSIQEKQHSSIDWDKYIKSILTLLVALLSGVAKVLTTIVEVLFRVIFHNGKKKR